jgi:mannose-1-phosphate guanylyltransferase / mannose-6-phosphate isomerase
LPTEAKFFVSRRPDQPGLTVNELVKTVHENESIYIPIGAVHRLENPGKILLELIEVQTGSYLGEDDIIRIEDDYQRS